MSTEDQSRSDFEAFFRQSRAEKRPDRVASMFDRMDGGDYAQDHTQRHWWTWQNAIKAGRFTSGASMIPVGGLAEEAHPTPVTNEMVTAAADVFLSSKPPLFYDRVREALVAAMSATTAQQEQPR